MVGARHGIARAESHLAVGKRTVLEQCARRVRLCAPGACHIPSTGSLHESAQIVRDLKIQREYERGCELASPTVVTETVGPHPGNGKGRRLGASGLAVGKRCPTDTLACEVVGRFGSLERAPQELPRHRVEISLRGLHSCAAAGRCVALRCALALLVTGASRPVDSAPTHYIQQFCAAANSQ